MPYLQTLDAYLTQSTLLIQAHPKSTRITTKYNVSPPDPFVHRAQAQKSTHKYTHGKTPRISADAPPRPQPAPSNLEPTSWSVIETEDTVVPQSKKRKRSKPPADPLPQQLTQKDFDAAVAEKTEKLGGPVGSWVLKTYCPENGITLKYSTVKAAEVGRLMAGLTRLGRLMSRGGEVVEDELVKVEEVGEARGNGEVSKPGTQGQGGGGEGAGKKKKKKGKR